MKLKKIAAVLCATLVFVTLGTVKVKAVTDTYDFPVASLSAIAKGGTGSLTATADVSGNSKVLSITNTNSGGTISFKSPNIEIQKLTTTAGDAALGAEVIFEIETLGDASLKLSTFDTGGTSKYWYMSIDGATAVKYGKGDATLQLVGAMNHTITLTSDTTSTSNLKITAIQLIESYESDNSYTVTFDDQGNTTTTTVAELECVSNPGNPTEPEGMSFMYWCLDLSNPVEFDFSTPITTDITLHAYYVAKIYKTVTFIVDDVEYDSTQVLQNLTVDLPQPTKVQHNFIKWVDINGVEFTENTIVTDDVTLYAVFERFSSETITNTYNFPVASLAAIAVGASGNLNATAEGKTDSKTLKITNNASGGTISYKSSNIEIQKNSSTAGADCLGVNVVFEVETLGDATLKLATFDTGGTSKYWAISVDGATATRHTKGDVTLQLVGAKNHTIAIASEETCNSNLKISAITLNETYVVNYPTATIEYQHAQDYTAVRFIGTIENIDALDIALVTVEMDLYDGSTLLGAGAPTVMPTIYKSIKGTKVAADDTYYIAYTLTGLSDVGTAYTIKAKLVVELTDGTTVYVSNVVAVNVHVA